MTTKNCPCANPDCTLPSGRCALCDQPCDADGRTHEPELCDPCADIARNVRSKLNDLDPGWHVDDTGTPRLVRDDEANVFGDDEDAVVFVRGLLESIAKLPTIRTAPASLHRAALRQIHVAMRDAHDHRHDARIAEAEVERLRAEARDPAMWIRIDDVRSIARERDRHLARVVTLERDAERARTEASQATVTELRRALRDLRETSEREARLAAVDMARINDELVAERAVHDALRAEVEALRAGVGGPCRSVRDFVDAQRAFSVEAFGPGARTAGIVEHIRRELAEVEADPGDCFEWIDVVILALDGAWRAGHSAASIEGALWAKLAKNKARRWPDWRGVDEATPIEHVRDVAADALADLVDALAHVDVAVKQDDDDSDALTDYATALDAARRALSNR